MTDTTGKTKCYFHRVQLVYEALSIIRIFDTNKQGGFSQSVAVTSVTTKNASLDCS